MSNGPLTRKIITGTFAATFEGDYIPYEDVADYLQQWLDSGLYDRDDLVGWSFDVTGVTEEEMGE